MQLKGSLCAPTSILCRLIAKFNFMLHVEDLREKGRQKTHCRHRIHGFRTEQEKIITEEESEVTLSTATDDSPVDPSMPLWQRVTQFVDHVLAKHFRNISIYMRRFDDAPGRPRAKAPFCVRQHFGTGPTARLSVVRQHILRAVDHLQSTGGLVASGDGTRALSSRQGVG